MARRKYNNTVRKRRNNTINSFTNSLFIIGVVAVVILTTVIVMAVFNLINMVFLFLAMYIHYITTSMGIMFVLLFLLGCWYVIDKRRESWSRIQNGSYPLINKRINGEWVIVDPNKLPNGVNNLRLLFNQLPFNSEQQLVYNNTIQTTRSVNAMNTGNGNRISSAFGKMLSGYYSRPNQRLIDTHQEEDVVDVEPEEIELITVEEAIEQSTVDNWIVGQNKETGELYSYNPFEMLHYGIIGTTGTGKTAYMALLVMIYALKFKFRVTVLDGKGGGDWSKFSNLIEFYALDYTNIDYYLRQVEELYKYRQSVLNKYQVNNIFKLPSEARTPSLKPLFIITDEFGAVMASLKTNDKELYNDVCVRLENLLRLSRSTGIIFIFCDQDPKNWPSSMKANLPTNIFFKIGSGKGMGFSEYNLNQLDRTGHFQVDNKRYHAWKVFEVIDEVLGTFGDAQSNRKPLLLPYTSSANIENIDDTNEYTSIDIYPPTTGSDTMIQTNANEYKRVQTDTNDDTNEYKRVQMNTPDDTNVYKLSGKPMTKEEKEIVYIVHMRNNKNVSKTCEQLWGSRNPSRAKWIENVMVEYQ